MGAQDEAISFPEHRRAGHVPTSFSDLQAGSKDTEIICATGEG
jgi:hypothetical protein